MVSAAANSLDTASIFSKPAQDRLAKKRTQMIGKILGKRPNDVKPAVIKASETEMAQLAFDQTEYPDIVQTLLDEAFDRDEATGLDDFAEEQKS